MQWPDITQKFLQVKLTELWKLWKYKKSSSESISPRQTRIINFTNGWVLTVLQPRQNIQRSLFAEASRPVGSWNKNENNRLVSWLSAEILSKLLLCPLRNKFPPPRPSSNGLEVVLKIQGWFGDGQPGEKELKEKSNFQLGCGTDEKAPLTFEHSEDDHSLPLSSQGILCLSLSTRSFIRLSYLQHFCPLGTGKEMYYIDWVEHRPMSAPSQGLLLHPFASMRFSRSIREQHLSTLLFNFSNEHGSLRSRVSKLPRAVLSTYFGNWLIDYKRIMFEVTRFIGGNSLIS